MSTQPTESAISIPRQRDCDTLNLASPIEIIVRRAQAGDKAAQGLLYELHKTTVNKFICSRVSDLELAEDLAADTFLRMIRSLHTFQWQGSDFGAWLTTIARSAIATHFRSIRWRVAEILVAEFTDFELFSQFTEFGSFEEDDMTPDPATLAQLRQALSELSADEQECLKLRFIQGLTVEATAKAMVKEGAGAIKALTYRAMTKLRKSFNVEPQRRRRAQQSPR